jgi:chromosomal replication initiator protein
MSGTMTKTDQQTVRPGDDARRMDEAFSSRLVTRIGRRRYDMWFDQTARMRVDGNRVQVSASSQIVADWIGSHFTRDLHDVAVDLLGHGAQVEVAVSPALFGPATAGADVGRGAPLGRTEAEARPAPSHGPSHGPSARANVSPRRNWWRRVDDFVVGDCNRLAYEAVLSLAEAPTPRELTMIFLHGECGVGKTHLLQGACQRFSERNPSLAVRYTTGEQFTNEYIAAIRTNGLEEFRARMRRLDLLAIDDVHFLANKSATQAEFLHTIDAIGFSGARIALASDEHPRHIKRFSQGLVSRFLSGMVVRIDAPDRATRLALIRRLALSRAMRLSTAAEDLLAARCLGSVRELEGALTKLAALRLVSGADPHGEVGLILVEQFLDDHGPKAGAPIRIADIVSAIVERVGIDRAELLSNGRHRRVVLARGLVAHLARELTTMSFPEIARSLGRENHSTAHTADARIRQMLQADEQIEADRDGVAIRLRDLVEELRHVIARLASGR